MISLLLNYNKVKTLPSTIALASAAGSFLKDDFKKRIPKSPKYNEFEVGNRNGYQPKLQLGMSESAT